MADLVRECPFPDPLRIVRDALLRPELDLWMEWETPDGERVWQGQHWPLSVEEAQLRTFGIGLDINEWLDGTPHRFRHPRRFTGSPA